jgi:hypothetical protein
MKLKEIAHLKHVRNWGEGWNLLDFFDRRVFSRLMEKGIISEPFIEGNFLP